MSPDGGVAGAAAASTLAAAAAEARRCSVCSAHLPLGPRPVFRVSPTARLLIIGQAPGTRVHESGIPWNDASGRRLRAWMGVGEDAFYDTTRVAIVPMGFCYPGTDARGGDRPPRPECAPLWHGRLIGPMGGVALTLLVGSYAQARYLPGGRSRSLAERVAGWRAYAPTRFPLPHPSWRNTAWLKRHPWFEAEVLPALRARVAAVLAQPPGLAAPSSPGIPAEAWMASLAR